MNGLLREKSRMGNREMLILRYRRKQWRKEGSKVKKRLDVRFSKTGRNSKRHWTKGSLRGCLLCTSESTSVNVGYV